MRLILCPGTNCTRADTCIRAIRFAAEPSMSPRADTNMCNGDGADYAGIEWSSYVQDNGKRSLMVPNVANTIGDHIAAKWPELSRFPSLWCTGSTVWSFLYSSVPNSEADLDMFATNYDQWLKALALIAEFKIETPLPIKQVTSLGGQRWCTSRGVVDVWHADGLGATDVISQYPPTTHSHCRAAFNPATRTLLVIGNECATKEAEFDLAERSATWWMERAQRLERAS